MKLWGGRFKGEPDSGFAQFNSSFRFDRRLIEADIEGSLAHAEALAQAGLIRIEEAREIESGLKSVLDRARDEAGYLDSADAEDVHSFVESELVKAIGKAGYKLHTGRSRNDQVATDLRLLLRKEIESTKSLIRDLQIALIELAESNRETVIPGYTHLQRAQPVLFPHYCLAYYEMLKRDDQRIFDLRKRVNRMPLGSGALAGTGFQLDRDQMARRLGFEGLCENSLDGVGDRDFVVEFAGAASLIMMHLSRLAEDLIIYSTMEFGFIELSDAVATGSSLMPQKKNPDALELVRGKAGRVFGHHAALLVMLKGLPLAYNKDMQEDKEALFDTIDTLNGCLGVMAIVLRNTTVNALRTSQAVSAGHLNSTDLADYLVRRGLEFRLAHELVGKVVSYAIEHEKSLADLALEEYRAFSPLFDSELYRAISIESSIASKAAVGGTSPARVSEALARAKAEVGM